MKNFTLSQYKAEAKETLQIGLPIVVGQLGIMAMGVADTIQVGMIPLRGAVSVAAAGLANSVFFTVVIIGIIALGVVAPMISKAEAEKNGTEIKLLFRAALKAAIYLAIFTGLIGFVVGYFLDIFDQDPEVTALAKPFNYLICLSVFPLFIFLALRQLSDGLGKTRLAMFATLSALLLNILLNFVLINGFWFIPRLELVGTGWATLIARFYMVGVLWYLIRREIGIAPYLQTVKESVVGHVKRIFQIGLPAGMQGFFEVGVFAAAVIVIGWHGKYEMSAHFIAINMCSVTYMMVTGIASAGGIRVGHFWGLRDKPHIYLAGNTALAMAASFMGLCGLLFVFFPDWLVGFYTDDQNVVPTAISLLMIGGLFQLSDGFQATALGILRGIAEVNVPTILTLIAYWVVGLPIGYVLSYTDNLKAVGMWLGLTAGLTASAILLCWRFYRTVGKMKI